jgi:hypothetical protein
MPNDRFDLHRAISGLLPPISSVKRFSVLAASTASMRPVCVEPVKVIMPRADP